VRFTKYFVLPALKITSARPFCQACFQYVTDLGLIRRKPQVTISNPIYREIIPRMLTASTQDMIPVQTAWYVDADGRLDMAKLMSAFQEFFREHSEYWIERFDYKEAGRKLRCNVIGSARSPACVGEQVREPATRHLGRVIEVNEHQESAQLLLSKRKIISILAFCPAVGIGVEVAGGAPLSVAAYLHVPEKRFAQPTAIDVPWPPFRPRLTRPIPLNPDLRLRFLP
jgi:hypothetical protein